MRTARGAKVVVAAGTLAGRRAKAATGGRMPAVALALAAAVGVWAPRVVGADADGGVPATPATASVDVAADQSQQARIAMEVDTTAIHVGDPVSVRLAVDHPAGWSVLWADSVDVSPFEVQRFQLVEPLSDEGGVARSVAELVVTSFELGELELPPIQVLVAAPGGSVDTLTTDPFRIGVESVGLDDTGDIREIKGPLSIARSWWGPLAWLVLAVAVAAGAVHLWRRRRIRPVVRPAGPPPPPPRPHDLVALEALAALEASSMLERGEVKEYHVQVSEIVRTYVEGQLAVPALELTTGEVVAGLRRAALGEPVCSSFGAFLERCDLVKFAKWRPSATDSRGALEQARELVRMTSGRHSRPQGEPVQESQPSGGAS